MSWRYSMPDDIRAEKILSFEHLAQANRSDVTTTVARLMASRGFTPTTEPALREYMQTHGWGDLPPIVVDQTGQIIDGVKRAITAKALGMDTCTSVVLEIPGTPEEMQARRWEIRHALNSVIPMHLDEVQTWLMEGQNT